MSDRNNDKIKSFIQGRLGNYSHPVGEDLWPLIARGLQMQMRRNRVVRMISMVAGVAAVILVTLLLLPMFDEKDVVAPSNPPVATYIAAERKPDVLLALQSVDHVGGGKLDKKKIEPIQTPKQERVVPPKEQQPITTPVAFQSDALAEENDRNQESALNRVTHNADCWSEDASIGRKRRDLSLAFAFNGIGYNSQTMDRYHSFSGNIGSSEPDVVDRNSRFDFPINVGVLVSMGINKRLSVESGLSYTYLCSHETIKTDDVLTEESSLKLHYLGIPLKAACVIYRNNVLSLYGSAGIMGEKLLSGSRIITYPIAQSNNIATPGIQWSVSAAVGMDFKLGKRWGVYCEPGINYYFDDGSDLYTVRKERPLSFNLQAGLRFRIR